MGRDGRSTMRLAARAAAVGTALVLLAVTGPAPATARAVDASDFPGVRQVAGILPAYAGGTRYVEGDHPIWVFRRNCLSYENGPSAPVRKWAYYDAIEPEPGSYLRFYVHEFASAEDAQQAIRVIRQKIERCYGSYRRDSIDGTFIRREADIPPLGDGRPVAWKMNDHWTEQRDGFEHSYYSRRIWMREGETVIGVDLWGDGPQSRDAAIRLARLALTTVD